jgi:RND family efflux transporter MFP subunit
MPTNQNSIDRPSSADPNQSKNKRKKKFISTSLILLLLTAGTWIFQRHYFQEWDIEVTQAIVYPEANLDLFEENSSSFFKGELLFQATGWIEPDPFPIMVTSLYSGVVDKVHILEGQKVKNGQVIVSLIAEDAQLAYDESIARLSQSFSEEAIIKADIDFANASLSAAMARVTKDEILLEEKNDSLSRLTLLPTGAVAEQVLYQTKLGVKKQQAMLSTSNSEVKKQQALVEKLKMNLRSQQIASKIFSIQKERSELDLNRTQVKSPVDGIVLRSLSKPGSRMMLHMDGMDAAAAAILYEEGKLQARIDVPLSEAAKINLGQSVEVSSSIFPEKIFQGKVSRILGEADLQRNTLQVKVSLLDPHPKLRPDMLCRAKFFEVKSKKHSAAPRMKTFIKQNIYGSNQVSPFDLWVVSKDGNHAESRTVSLGSIRREGYIEVSQGLLPGDRVILDPPPSLKEGDRIKIIKIQ